MLTNSKGPTLMTMCLRLSAPVVIHGGSPAHVSEIVGRLRRIPCLPSGVLEDNEYSLDKAAFVDWEPLYNLKASERAQSRRLGAPSRPGAST
jgi:hypothetical protein